jgi:hypothetical protein
LIQLYQQNKVAKVVKSAAAELWAGQRFQLLLD